MADLEKIVEDLSSLTVLEAAELSKMLEEKWGVSAAAPVAVAAVAGAGGAGEDAAEEKTEFDVVLAEAGASKINVIKNRLRKRSKKAFPRRKPRKFRRSSKKQARKSSSSKILNWIGYLSPAKQIQPRIRPGFSSNDFERIGSN